MRLSQPRETLLLVDDNEALRDRLARAFRDRGFEVATAGSVAEGEASARAQQPDLAVIDLRMGDGIGLELLKRLKSISPETRAVIVTGYGSISTAVEATKLGAVNYVPKPADADDILEAFERGAQPPLTASTGEHEVPSLARAEWEHIHRVLTDCGGNISRAARRLGIHRRTLQRKLDKYPPRR